MNRQEHIEWCQRRAYDYLNQGDIVRAWASFGSDMNAHDETRNHSALLVGMQLIMIGELNTPDKMRRFIDGFH
jgi:hypothetical protein